MVEILSLLIAAVIAVLISMRLGLGSQLGYLAAGAVIGPYHGTSSQISQLRTKTQTH